MRSLDYIIVGQGITGTCIALMLLERGKKIKIIDNYHKHSSTKLAAGIINPVTGRKYVKSWMVDSLLSYANDFYTNLEEQFDISIVHNTEIKRNMPNITALNDWMARCQDEQYEAYVKEVEPNKILSEHIHSDHGFSTIKNVLRVDIAKLITVCKDYFIKEGLLIEEEFEHLDLNHQDGIKYHDLNADKIIFCEGYRCIYNPYFRHLPFIPLKGEVVELRIPDLSIDYILRHNRFLVPKGNDIYWTGGGYEKENIDQEPTEDYLEHLQKDLRSFLNCPYEILSHSAAVRPAIRDRKPVIGEHTEYRNIYLCNGMGTKGASLAPYFCNMLIDNIEAAKPILSDVSIERFLNTHYNE